MPEPLDPGLNEVAAALAALRPNPPVLDRDRLLFRAGRASAPRLWFWRAATAAATLAAAVLGGVLVFRPAPAPVVQIVYRDRDQPQPQPAPSKQVQPPPAPTEYEPPEPPYPWPTTPYGRLQDRVLRWGLDGLAEPDPPPAAPPATVDSLLRSL